jgi:hypothetical protein
MLQTNIAQLRVGKWYTPFPEDDPGFQVKLIPAAAVEVGKGFIAGDQGLCRDAFVEFKGYWQDTEKKKPVENSLDMRLELLTYSDLRDRIRIKLTQWNEAIARGEDLDG